MTPSQLQECVPDVHRVSEHRNGDTRSTDPSASRLRYSSSATSRSSRLMSNPRIDVPVGRHRRSSSGFLPALQPISTTLSGANQADQVCEGRAIYIGGSWRYSLTCAVVEPHCCLA